MKKYTWCLLLVISTLVVCCKRSFIDLAPITSTSTESFYKTSNDMVNAVTAVYSSLQGAGAASEEFMFGDIPTDDAQAVSALCAQGHCGFDNYTNAPVGGDNSTQISNRYNAAYVGISRANTVLGRIDAVAMDATLKARLIAETKFLRAYYYFNLVKCFGGVPLVLKEITSPEQSYDYGRETAANVFVQIEKDFTEAAAGLPNTYTATSDIGRVTAGAAKGMLARVLLFEGKFSQAAPILKGIIDNQGTTQYDLLPNFADVFKYNNGNNKEILFSVQYSGGGLGVGAGPTNTFTSTNADQPTVNIYNEFETGDIRRDATVNIQNISGNTFGSSYVVKFADPTVTVPGDANTDYPVLRYADILLMYAECLNENDATAGFVQALPYINKVRTRAGLAALQTTNAAVTATYVTGQANFRTRIMHERRVELAFEGLRFFDLVRTNNLLNVMNAYFAGLGNALRLDDHNKLWPIPQTQIDVNPTKMVQNPGY
ncbi:RagB/SusD family nutrient uptake outer membrane protein [Mucilaginibacter sp. AW1-3]